jgi:hypothetical protein
LLLVLDLHLHLSDWRRGCDWVWSVLEVFSLSISLSSVAQDTIPVDLRCQALSEAPGAARHIERSQELIARTLWHETSPALIDQ